MRGLVNSLLVLFLTAILLNGFVDTSTIVPPQDEELESERIVTLATEGRDHEDDTAIGEDDIVLVGAVTVFMFPQLIIPAGVLYVWASSLASDQPESGIPNTFDANDAAASVSAATDDTLMVLTWNYAEQDLNWAFVVMKLSVGDNTYDCALVDGEGDCIISQDGDDDALWEMDEFLVLSENDVDICSDGCEIEIFISYRGNVVAGDSYVPVQ